MFPTAILKVADKGFTLLEVLLTVVLMASGFIFLLQAMSAGLFVGGENETELVASNLIQEKIEDIRNQSYSSIVSEGKAALGAPFQKFSRSVDIVSDAPVTNMKKITVTVYWNVKGNETNKNVVTYVSNL